MKDEIKIPDEFNELKKAPPFKVPDNYFDSFNSRLMDRIAKDKAVPWYEKLFRFARPRLALATSLVTLFIIAFIITKIIIDDQHEFELSTEEIADILQDDAFYLDENDLFALLEKDEDQYIDSEYNLTEEDIINYLEYEDDNLDLFIEDF